MSDNTYIMAANALGDLRTNILAQAQLGERELHDLRWEVGGFRDHDEQAVLSALRKDVADGKVSVDPAVLRSFVDYVGQGEDGIGQRLWNATKGAAIGLTGVGLVGAGLYALAPSIVMWLVAYYAMHQLAVPAAILGAGFGAAWDN